MKTRNEIRVRGYAGSDADVRYTKSGLAVLSVNIADTKYRKIGEEEFEKKTTWHRIVAFGNLAEANNGLIKKGSVVIAEGRLEQKSYTDKEGNNRTSFDLVCDFLGVLKEQIQTNIPVKEYKQAPTDNNSTFQDDDIPF
ncbi:MAG: single-stranded DNA-binding protein [Candidatus Heimdallarchaeota archaeon]